jgi:SAM-dependent methyltransferase
MCERLGVTSINTERIDYALGFVHGRLLDVGCGRNHLVKKYPGFGVGVDVFDWSEGALILRDTSRLPFLDRSFDTVTVLAALNHISNRVEVLREALRVLRDDGRLVMTMIPPGLSALGHKVLWWHGEDWARGMGEGEVYGFTTQQITAIAAGARFELLEHHRFLYRLNHLYVFRKRGASR